MDTATEPTTHPAAALLLAHLARRPDNPAARAWDGIMREAIYAGATGTARAWFTAHHGHEIRTLQANVHESGDVSGVWTPGARIADASRASFARLNDSRREYAGLRVVASTPDTLIAALPWGDGTYQVCVYTAREG